MSKGKLVLIDGHSLAFRAYHALPPTLSTTDGLLTNAVFGFTSMLLKVLQEEKPDYMAVAFDVGRTFRHEQYTEYKAHRGRMPDELAVQMRYIEELIKAFNIPVYTVPGYEADDVLGTLSKQAGAQGVDTIIVTGDTDAFQLIDPHIRVLTSRRQFGDTVVYDEEAIRARYGLTPQQLIDFKALVGDKSDNIPGVAGIGEKTAASLLQQYGSLENIYEHLEEVPDRFRKALAEGREMAFLSKRLVTIITDAPVKLDLQACQTAAFDRDRVVALFRELEFRSLLDRLPEARPAVPRVGAQQLALFPEQQPLPRAERPIAGYQVVNTESALEALVSRLREAGAFALDVETTSVEAVRAALVGIAVSPAPGEGYYIPLGHTPLSAGNLPIEMVRARLKPVLEDPALPKYAHNAGYDLTVLWRHGFEVAGLAFDTMVAEWLSDPGSRNLGLKNLVWARLGVEMTPITDLIGSGKGQITIDQVPIAQVAAYAGADVDMTYRLVGVLEAELKEKALWSLFTEVEMPLVPVLMDMELAGIRLDVSVLKAMSSELQVRLLELEREIQDAVGYAFNIGSTQQLSDALFIKLGLPTQGLRKTKAGHYSTAAEVLQRFRGWHPVVDMVLEHRELAKLKSTYVDALPALVNPATGRLHTSFNQTGTVTGRLSSSNPNLQNIPIRTEIGRQVRRAFIADPGWVLLAADYSQVELRILAHVSQDPTMLAAFARGEDIHRSTAAAIYRVPLDQVTPEMRRVAKTTNFAISYGVSGYGLAQQTGMTPEEGERFIQSYFATYPRIKAWLDKTKAKAATEGYVETLLGRRRYFPELQSGVKAHENVRAAAYRMAVNAPIQGSAADIIKVAMIRLHKALAEQGLQARMLLQVHDELVLEVPEKELSVVAPLVKEIMEGAFQLDAPLKVDMSVGQNWLDMEEVRLR